MAAKQIDLKLVVDKERNRVLFAECGNDFVDVLLSFLTMPIGTIIRLSGKESKIGSMSTLYESVEVLDVNLLQTAACKKMLLCPKSACEAQCKKLKVNIDDTERTKYYVCWSRKCRKAKSGLVTTVFSAQCLCGDTMVKEIEFEKRSDVVAYSKDGVFVKGNMRFLIRDDLQVLPVSTTATFALVKELGISDAAALEERNVNVGAAEVLHLLKRLLLSETLLTDVFLSKESIIDGANVDFKVNALDSKDMAQSQAEKRNDSDSKKMSVKVLVNKSNNKVLYAETGEDFADLLFGFLAFPLVSVTKFCGEYTGMTCLDNLYRIVQVLSMNGCIKSNECKGLLLDPKIAPYFRSSNQLLQIKEQVPWKYILCSFCGFYVNDSPMACSCGTKRTQLHTINPKYFNPVKDLGGTFVGGPATFTVTDELNVRPFSPMSVISLLSKSNFPMSDLEERIVSVGEEEALALLKASFVSETTLTDVFYTKKLKHLGRGSYKKVKTEVLTVYWIVKYSFISYSLKQIHV